MLAWDGNSTKPQCTEECKTMINNRKLFTKMEQMDCCMCDKDKHCIKKKNVEILCDIQLDRSDECQNKKKICEDIRAKESNLDHRGIHRIVTDLSSALLTIFILSDVCPPRMCDDCHQRCRNDKLCTRFYNDVEFYCRNVLEWQDDQAEPTCTPICQMAINKLASVTNRTMGYNIMCCTCGNYTDQRSNNLVAIRGWEKCRRGTRNIKQFCKHNCTDCDEMRPMSERQHMSMHLVSLCECYA